MDNKKATFSQVNPSRSDGYDDGNIPGVDLPDGKNAAKPVEPLPESSRPRRDGPGGE